jgi:hypothetical protein
MISALGAIGGKGNPFLSILPITCDGGAGAGGGIIVNARNLNLINAINTGSFPGYGYIRETGRTESTSNRHGVTSRAHSTDDIKYIDKKVTSKITGLAAGSNRDHLLYIKSQNGV